MADNVTPIPFRQFKGEVDAEYVDSEDIDINVLASLQNTTPFKVVNSLSLASGHSLLFSAANLPSPSGYKLIDWYSFSIDKDNKEATIVVYYKESTKDVKIYVNPWFNPKSTDSNYYSGKTEASWISEWLELTESYNIKASGTVATNKVTLNGTFSITTDDYLNGFFVVNRVTTRRNRFNFITDYNGTTKQLTLQAETTTSGVGISTDWCGASGTDADDLTIVRFPVRYLYHFDNNTFVPTYGDSAPIMNCVPSQFIYRENAVRIPCGKTRKPLIMQFIEDRRWFKGDNEMSYCGWYFDFQNPQQVYKKSAVSAFGAAFSPTGTTNIAYLENTGGVWDWNSSPHATNASVKFEFLGSGGTARTVRVLSYTPVSGYNNPPGSCNRTWNYYTQQWEYNCNYLELGWTKITNDIYIYTPFNGTYMQIYVKIGATITAAQLATIQGSLFSTGFNITVQNTGSMASVAAGLDLGQIFIYGNSTIGYEFAGNTIARNLFLGLELEVTPLDVTTSWEGADRYKFIICPIIDNRSHCVFAHGAFRPKIGDGSSETGSGMQFRLTPWFSRRMTGINCFNQKHDDIPAIGFPTILTFPSIGQEIAEYPYFQYVDGKVHEVQVRINEVKKFADYSLYNFQKTTIRNAAPYRMNISNVDPATGLNAYTYDYVNGCWYVNINSDCGWDDSGEGTSFIATLNRYIDQDNGLCYTRGTFVGDTNGKFFVSGVGNQIEAEKYISDDNIHMNVYAIAVSEYDTYRTDKRIPVLYGDKDNIVSVENSKGYLNVVKQFNYYTMNIGVREIEYTVVDTELGRGCEYPDAIIQTPYGTVLPSSDGVYLVTPSGIEAILDVDNGLLGMYKDNFTNVTGTRNISAVFAPKSNELFLFSSTLGVGGARVMVYNFRYKFWYHLYTDSSNPTKVRQNTNSEVGMIIGDQIVKFDLSSNVFILDDHSTLPISLEATTHPIPMAGRVKDFALQWITLYFDVQSAIAQDVTIQVKVAKEYSTTYEDATEPIVIPSTSGVMLKGQGKEVRFKMIEVMSVCSIYIAVSGATKFNLNSFYVWVSKQDRKMGRI